MLRVAAVQAAPVFLDRAATTEKVIALVEEAAAAGAEVIGFPEGFLPGHPGWVELLPQDDRALALSKSLFKNAVEVPGPEIEAIAAACGRARIAAVLGICERLPRTTGTLFNTHVFIDADGAVAGKHQKFVATIGERLVHGPGTTGSFNAFRTGDITVSGLICGENSNPLAQYATARAYPTVHVASWPQHFSPALEMQPVIELVSKALAYTLKSFVINSVTTIGPEMLEAYGDAANADFLASDAARGRASIVAPSGEILAIADSHDEQLVYADVDPDDVIVPKFVHDYAGHYNRPELFAHLFETPPADAPHTSPPR
jgi:nitrilase